VKRGASFYFIPRDREGERKQRERERERRGEERERERASRIILPRNRSKIRIRRIQFIAGTPHFAQSAGPGE